MIRHRVITATLAAIVIAGISSAPFQAQNSPAAPATGTSSIRGRVIDTETGQPIAFAEVVLSARVRNVGPRLTVFAGEDGVFAFETLAAGSYYLAAQTATYPPGFYAVDGRVVADPGDAIDVARNQRRDGIELRLARGAAISGRVLDRNGEPVGRAWITILRRPWQADQDEVFFFSPRMWWSDVNGNYRVYGLPAGDYIVGVGPLSVPNFADTPGQPASKYVRTFYPGVADASLAQTIAVVSGQDRTGVDLRALFVSLFKVAASVTVPPEADVDYIYMQMVPMNRDGGDESIGNSMYGRGLFETRLAPPGRYWLTARANAPYDKAQPDATGNRYPAMWWAAIPVTVVDREVTGLSAVLQPAMTISGRLEIEGEPTTTDYRQWVIGLRRTGLQMIPDIPAPGPVDAGGRFTIRNVTPGRFRLAVLGAPSPASVLLSVNAGSTRLPDGEVDVTAGTNIDSLVVRVRR